MNVSVILRLRSCAIGHDRLCKSYYSPTPTHKTLFLFYNFNKILWEFIFFSKNMYIEVKHIFHVTWFKIFFVNLKKYIIKTLFA